MAEKKIENMPIEKHEHECPKCGKRWGCIWPPFEGSICRREADGDTLCFGCEFEGVAIIRRSKDGIVVAGG